MEHKDISITWLGHSCFAIEKDGYRIITDPYADGTVPGYGPLRIDADEVFCSHEHDDHNAAGNVTIRTDAASKKNPFKVTKLSSWHDTSEGKKRGPNTIHIFDDGTYRIAHMGDLGCMPSPEQRRVLSDLTVCLVPVGGFFTMKPEQVFSLMHELHPEVVIPMHYRFQQGKTTYGYRLISDIKAYRKMCPDAVDYDRNCFLLPEDLKIQTAFLTYKAE